MIIIQIKARILEQYCRDESALNDEGAINDFTGDNATINLFKIKEKISNETVNNGTKYVKIMVPLKYPSKFGELLNTYN